MLLHPKRCLFVVFRYELSIKKTRGVGVYPAWEYELIVKYTVNIGKNLGCKDEHKIAKKLLLKLLFRRNVLLITA